MLITTITVDAGQTAADAVSRITGLPDDAWVVVRRRENLDVYWYSVQAGTIRRVATYNADQNLTMALGLHEWMASDTFQLGTEEGADTGILLDGQDALGLLAGDAGNRGIGPPSPPVGLPALGADDESPQSFEDVTSFGAYPALDCPKQVTVAQSFELEVRLSENQAPGTGGGPIEVPTELKEFDLVVSLVAPGFTSDRIRDVLHVVRSDLAANEVRFSLTPEPIEGDLTPATVQIDFTFGGELVGRAWRALIVAASAGTPVPVAIDRALDEQPPATPILLSSSVNRPDLTITITENDESTQLEWQFETPHPGVELPTESTRKRFKAHNAKSFAMEQIRVLDEAHGTGAAASRMLGTARTIADEIPPVAWRVLSDVWLKTKADGRCPTVQLVCTDAYVPWELASTEDAYVDQALVDASLPPILGAQVCISRWIAPQPRGAHGVLNPQLPPPEIVNVSGMALVIGDYLAENGTRPLPMAKQEGNELLALYAGLPLTATLETLSPLFKGNVVRDGQAFDPNVVHFACHGQIDPNPGFNGIVLNDGNVRLDSLYVAGSRMARPFVFLNACQVGQNTQLLDDAGGLATSFLKTGASGFVAPLWSVDDQLALETALAFYKAAFDERVPVAEILRRRRGLFDANAAQAQLTHLAYTYYGHPNLVLARS